MACSCKLALGGVLRGGGRAGCLTSKLVGTIGGIRIDGAGAPTRILLDSLTVQDALNEVPNSATFTARGVRPAEGAEVILSFQSVNNGVRLFAGNIVRVTQNYLGDKPQSAPNYVWHCEATDYTWTLNQKVVTARYRNTSATAIVKDLVATWAPAGYTAKGVQANLPVLDEITMTDTTLMDGIRQVAQRIGGYANCDYFKDVQLWISDADTSPLRALDPTHPTMREVSYARDLTQIVTRAIVEGGGVNARAAVSPGNVSIPVDDTAWYDATGGYVVSGPQRIRYTGIEAGGYGTLAGPSVQPTAALVGTPDAAAGSVGVGTYQYGFTWVTASGETVPSPITTVPMTAIAPPLDASFALFNHPSYGSSSNLLRPGDVLYATVSYSTSTNGNNDFAHDTVGAAPKAIQILNYPNVSGYVATPMMTIYFTKDPRVKTIHVWQLAYRGATLLYSWKFSMWAANVPTQWGQESTLAVNALPPGNPAPPAPNPYLSHVTLSEIAPGPAGTVSRKVYRTVADGATLKQLIILNDNTTTMYGDGAADSALGATAPTGDTSGLKPTTGQVNQGATEIPVASTTMFTPPGYVVIGNGEQVVRYTGKTATALTGIPATGEGAITASVQYGSSVTAAALLTGIPVFGDGAIKWALLPGDPVNVLVIVDDTAAQAALAALIGGTGIQEAKQADHRVSFVEARSRALAMLALNKDPIATVRYRVRDPNTRTGKTIGAYLFAPANISGYFKIQSVSISGFHPRLYPVYDVVASSSRFTFEDLLRRQRGRL